MFEASKRLGENVRDRRKAAQLSQADLAALSGLDTSTVSRLERGELNPTLTTLLALAITLECEAFELIEGVEPPKLVARSS
ncbi:helix-turn-helix domain-containing protein [Leifsonia sp. Leaf336]|uniref:helix-turn-helix domain-containing protein n=1 Tax=Leifsonia sp. Leaf336 TaxID=1736341 RepID=UPI0009E713F8|nr:helix-turn-helix transcriptional regulator [Leifsonia sp. Leaf336]